MQVPSIRVGREDSSSKSSKLCTRIFPSRTSAQSQSQRKRLWKQTYLECSKCL